MDFTIDVIEGVRNTPSWIAEGFSDDTGEHQYDEDGLIIPKGSKLLESSLRGPQAPNLVAGMQLGAVACAADIARGSIQLVAKPLQAKPTAQARAQALGEGLLYFAAAPVAGALDLTEGIVEGLGNTPQYLRDQASLAAQQLQSAMVANGIGRWGTNWGSSADMTRGRQMRPVMGMTLWMEQQRNMMMASQMLPMHPSWNDVAMQQHQMQMAAMTMNSNAMMSNQLVPPILAPPYAPYPPLHGQGPLSPMASMGPWGPMPSMGPLPRSTGLVGPNGTMMGSPRQRGGMPRPRQAGISC